MRKARRIREGRGLAVTDVAAAVGLDPAVISRFETGTRDMRLLNLEKLQAFYGVPFQELTENDPTFDEAASRQRQRHMQAERQARTKTVNRGAVEEGA